MDDQPILLEPEPMAAPMALPIPDSAARWAAGAMALALFVGVTGAGARAATHFAVTSKAARPAAATHIAPPPAPVAPTFVVTATAAPTEAAALDTGFAAGADAR